MNNKILIVVGNYYEEVSNLLILGATNFLKENKIEYKIDYVPGAFEIPFAINKSINKYNGFIALGCIIRGDTFHFELIANQSTRKIMDISVNYNKPIGFGILTCDNLEQALERSNPNKKNKGKEAAKACLSLLKLYE